MGLSQPGLLHLLIWVFHPHTQVLTSLRAQDMGPKSVYPCVRGRAGVNRQERGGGEVLGSPMVWGRFFSLLPRVLTWTPMRAKTPPSVAPGPPVPLQPSHPCDSPGKTEGLCPTRGESPHITES